MVYLQQGPLQEVRASPSPPRSTNSPPPWTRSWPRASPRSPTPAPSTRPSSTSTSSPSPRPTAPGSTATSCTRARPTSTTPAWTYGAETFADWVKKGYIGKKSSGLKAEDAGRLLHPGQVPDPVLRQLVVRPLQDGGQVRLGHLPVARHQPHPRLRRQPLGRPQGRQEQGPGLRLHRHHHVEEDPEPARQQGRRPGRGRPRRDHRPARPRSSSRTSTPSADSDGLAFYPDWPVPGFYDVLVSETQKLITGSEKPDAYLSALQEAYDKGVPTT